MILALESSCDESALALFDPEKGLKGEWVSSQIDLHAAYGGVVPDLASREHLRNFAPLLQSIPAEALGAVRGLAVTRGPGLAACLALGMAAAKSLAIALGCPLQGVNHLRAHAWSVFIDLHEEAPCNFQTALEAHLPHLGLLVSGGHTQLFAIETDKRIRLLAETVDDAAGEAIDKGAKLLGLPYPGGPEVERRAREGSAKAYDFPRAFRPASERKFSFSGLKTSLRYRLEKLEDSEREAVMADLCASYQEAVVDALLHKCRQLLESGAYKSLGLSGGVSNNTRLREGFCQLGQAGGVPALLARPAHTGDNAAMVAFAAWLEAGAMPAGLRLGLHPSLSLEDF